MPKATKTSASQVMTAPGYRGAFAGLEGGYTVAFEEFAADADPAPLFRGLPDDRCQCPHWGVVVSGKIVLRYADHEEVYEAGDAYYAPPGHVPLVFAGTETVEFSPTDDLGSTVAAIRENLAAMGAPA